MKLVMVATPEHSGKYNCAAKNRLLGITVRSLQVYVGVAGNNNLFQDMLPIYWYENYYKELLWLTWSW